MHVVIAIDSFKDCLSSAEVANHLSKGIRRVFPSASVDEIPVADGGEGTVDSMCVALQAEKIFVPVQDPLGRKVEAFYGWDAKHKTAIIEMAAASGIERLLKTERNPMLASTFGTGELILAALDKGCEQIIIGIGGSATNDGGMGMAKALGVRFFDEFGVDLPEGGGALKRLSKIDVSGIDVRLKKISIKVACDVSNTLTGEKGASFIFGPQKGASENQILQLDANLTNFANIIKQDLNIDILNLSGGGAAGGLGVGLHVFASAVLVTGFDLIDATVGLEKRIALADFVITGEGRMDAQTINGKTPFGVAKLATKYGKTVIGIAGQLGDGYELLFDYGFSSIFTISDGRGGVEDSLRRAPELLESIGERIFRLIDKTK